MGQPVFGVSNDFHFSFLFLLVHMFDSGLHEP
jgi:hypothetical protein